MRMHAVAAAASEALVKLGRESVPYTLPYLDHPNDFAKMLSLRALGELAAPEAEARATDLLAHPSFAVANAAAEALGKIGRANGSVKAVDALAAAAVLPSNHWPAMQIAALGATRNPAAIPRLRAIAKSYRDRRSPLASNVDALVAQEIQRIEKAQRTGTQAIPSQRPTRSRRRGVRERRAPWPRPPAVRGRSDGHSLDPRQAAALLRWRLVLGRAAERAGTCAGLFALDGLAAPDAPSVGGGRERPPA